MTQLQDGEVAFAKACPFDREALVVEVVDMQRWIHALRCEADVILAAHRAGTATSDSLRRYGTIRLALALQASDRRLPILPESTDDVLRRRRELIVETLLGPLGDEPSLAS
jgi:hypothetical protein